MCFARSPWRWLHHVRKNEPDTYFCFYRDLGAKLSSPVAAEDGVPAGTLSTNLKGKDRIIHATSSEIPSKKNNLKSTPHENLEEALFTWFKDMKRRAFRSAEEWYNKKRCFARVLGSDDFSASPRWLIFTADFSELLNHRLARASDAAITMS